MEADRALNEAERLISVLPESGQWTDEDYLWVTRHTRRPVELADGKIEVLDTPTERHQAIVAFLFLALLAVMQSGGKLLFAPFRLRLRSGRFREPDLLLLRSAQDPRRHDAYWDGADLVIEVVSEDDPTRDLITKRLEYAAAGIPEYWIVDTRSESITVLALDGPTCRDAGVYGRGAQARSVILPALLVGVSQALDA